MHKIKAVYCKSSFGKKAEVNKCTIYNVHKLY